MKGNDSNAAAQEVQQKWSKSQTLIGPILTIPYFYQNKRREQKDISIISPNN
ncbi:MAG: inner membrane CreD family protein [Butyricimonas paravirosa]